ncbi:MAG TPA: type I DNA topoisomerase [Candidatus Omnitrophota bacterium]|nr:type I DNA topoisomerase [Candidatus Omnitrophota bacterium]HSA31138.1 type I DNA topoisomerase [Candidatus Omnitrophota bacterium]
MANKLVIVESPTKIKTISKILGKSYKVTSSMGHLIDLPKSSLGVDVDHDFEPKMIVVRSKQKILSQLKKEAATKKEIYFATDPDREGEAIGWNLAQHLGEGKDIYRVTFQEITKDAVLRAFEKPRKFNENLINAQMARRILDRIVGYKISPLLWKKVGSRLSAGRVQSVALRLVVEREKDIRNFIPKEYWQIAVDLQKQGVDGLLTAQLERINGEKFELKTQAESQAIVDELKAGSYVVSGMTERQRQRKPLAPFITSTMQQEAFTKLGFNADRTMRVAQQLYEGVDIGNGETVGLITYMRTDSVNIAQEALGKLRIFIDKEYGAEYLPEQPNVYRSKKSAQEAHEAIRPTDVLLKPADVEAFLERDQFRLYELIWRRFVSSQMPPAIYKNRRLEISAGRFQFAATGSIIVFEGFLRASQDKVDDEAPIDLSQYDKGDSLSLVEVKPSQHFTKPPPRYSDASLVKALEEDGIGRPSTYASIIQTLVNRNYVLRDKGYFRATDLGIQVCDLLIAYFEKIMDIKFTASMEEDLDKVEDGALEYVKLLKEFYESFKKELMFAHDNMERTQTFVEQKCTECGRPMVVKWGRRGKFLSCSGFPKCKFAKPITTGVVCPQEGCGGELVQRSSRGGRFFYGCTKYPQCTYTSNSLPDPK